jgi:hypothetical protein
VNHFGSLSCSNAKMKQNVSLSLSFFQEKGKRLFIYILINILEIACEGKASRKDGMAYFCSYANPVVYW